MRVVGTIRSDGLYSNGTVYSQGGLNVSGNNYFWNKVAIGGWPGADPLTVQGRIKSDGGSAGYWVSDRWFIGRRDSTSGTMLMFWAGPYNHRAFEMPSADIPICLLPIMLIFLRSNAKGGPRKR